MKVCLFFVKLDIWWIYRKRFLNLSQVWVCVRVQEEYSFFLCVISEFKDIFLLADFVLEFTTNKLIVSPMVVITVTLYNNASLNDHLGNLSPIVSTKPPLVAATIVPSNRLSCSCTNSVQLRSYNTFKRSAIEKKIKEKNFCSQRPANDVWFYTRILRIFCTHICWNLVWWLRTY